MDNNTSCIAFFDFDGTITTKDSFLDFVKFARGPLRFYAGLLFLLPLLIGMKLKVVSAQRAKEKFLFHFFKRWSQSQFQQSAQEYSLNQMKEILIPKALEKIQWHQENKHEVVIVSASLESWLLPWCAKNNLQLIASRLAFQNEQLTAKLDGLNCNGVEKVNRIKNMYELSNYDLIYAYGNSSGDKEMLAVAHHSFYKYF